MSVLADHQIRKLCMFQDADKAGKWVIRADPMIHPFHNESINKNINGERVPSFGLSSYGYDVALGNEFKVFTNVHTSMIDPMDFDENCFVDVHKDDGDFIIIPPNSFILAVTKEYFVIPRDVVVTCLGKSTYARCGINCIVTPLEPEWEGHVTLEFANSTNLPAKMYVGAGCAQLQFHKGDAECEVSYKDRNGKYQGQLGVTLPK